MGFNLTNAPTEKPSSFSDIKLEDGIHEVTVEKCEYVISTNGNPMLRTTFSTVKEKKFVFDQIMDDPTKQINMYRLAKFLGALNISLSGEVELKDLPKIVRKGARLRIAIVTKENGYANIDINKYDGYYPPDLVVSPAAPKPAAPAPVTSAPAQNTPDLQAASDDEFY